jgi:hypothetical protein
MDRIKTGIVSIVTGTTLFFSGLYLAGDASNRYSQIHETRLMNIVYEKPVDTKKEEKIAQGELFYGGLLAFFGGGIVTFGGVYARLPEKEEQKPNKPFRKKFKI